MSETNNLLAKKIFDFLCDNQVNRDDAIKACIDLSFALAAGADKPEYYLDLMNERLTTADKWLEDINKVK